MVAGRLHGGTLSTAYNFFMEHKDALPDDSWTYLGKAHEYIAALACSRKSGTLSLSAFQFFRF